MADSTPKSYHTDPTLYLYTSLTSGSSQIVTATSRLETILKANKIAFQALDVATDEKARMLWGRRAKNKKLPGLVRMGMIVGDLNEVEEWNEYGELKENLEPAGPKTLPISTPTPSATSTPSKPPPSTAIPSNPPPAPVDTTTVSPDPTSSTDPSPAPAPATANEASFTTALRQAGFEAAKKASEAKIKARQDALAAAKSKDEGLQKLNNSGPTGMPPPSGITEAADAKEPETAGAMVGSKADKVPVAEEGATEIESPTQEDYEGIQQVKVGKKSASNPIAIDESEEVLEGTGQAEPSASPAQEIPSIAPPHSFDDIPSATVVEAAANESILKDKSHIVLVGREADRTPPSERADLGNEQVTEEPKSVGETPLREMTATDEAQDLPGTRTQEQEAAQGVEAGTSVAD